MTYSEVAVKFSTLTSPFYVDLGIAQVLRTIWRSISYCWSK